MDWHDCHILGKKRYTGPTNTSQRRSRKPWSFNEVIVNENARACLISGPPGIGKTTMVQLMAEEMGLELTMVNASDKRSKAVIENILKEMTESTSMNHYTKRNREEMKKRIVVMDEVDGLSGGTSDRGGINALIKIIKTSKMPIVCIANDHGSKKIVSLVNCCYDIKLNKPCNNEIMYRLKDIIRKEHLQIDVRALEKIINYSCNDIR